MEAIKEFFQSIDVFVSLKVDHTVLYQFVIFIVFFFVFKSLFLNKLQHILELRMSKTTGASNEADAKEQKATNLMEEYNEKMKLVYAEAGTVLSDGKRSVIKDGREELKTLEDKLEAEYLSKMEVASKEVMEKRTGLKRKSEELISALLTKLKLGN
jgi:F0F1-type ATP synthase membrane subunit b/b'